MNRLAPALLFASLGATATGCADEVDEPEAELAFVAPVDGVDQIWVSRADGSGRAPVTAGEFAKSSPKWTADGERLVFVEHLGDSSCSRSDRILVWERGVERELATSMDVRAIAIGGDDRGVFVVRDGCSEPGLFVRLGFVFWIDLDTGESSPISGHADVPHIAPAPVGDRVAIWAGAWDTASADPDEWVYTEPQIGVHALGSDDPVGIPPDDLREGAVSWHPSGGHLAFERRGPGQSAIWSANPDGTDVRPLTTPGVFESDPEWSPMGDVLLVQRTSPGPGGSVLVSDDGETEVATPGRFLGHWSPDGSKLLELDPDRLRVYDVASGSTTDIGEGRQADWR